MAGEVPHASALNITTPGGLPKRSNGSDTTAAVQAHITHPCPSQSTEPHKPRPFARARAARLPVTARGHALLITIESKVSRYCTWPDFANKRGVTLGHGPGRWRVLPPAALPSARSGWSLGAAQIMEEANTGSGDQYGSGSPTALGSRVEPLTSAPRYKDGPPRHWSLY